MTHEILGAIQPDRNNVFDGVATIQYGTRKIEVQISCDDQPFETAVKLAAEVVKRMDDLDRAAKRVASAELREVYNNGWNEYDEVQEDGSLRTVQNPKLSEAGFEEKLSLRAINVTGAEMVDFFYDDQGMFWGHSVVVTSLSGVDFHDARAELFG